MYFEKQVMISTANLRLRLSFACSKGDEVTTSQDGKIKLCEWNTQQIILGKWVVAITY